MGHSIQEYCKKINRQLTFIDIGSLLLTLSVTVGLVAYISNEQKRKKVEVVYHEVKTESSKVSGEKDVSSKPFGSKKGKTYTFTWCQGANKILPVNKIYFASPEEAERSGRTLSKLCKK